MNFQERGSHHEADGLLMSHVRNTTEIAVYPQGYKPLILGSRGTCQIAVPVAFKTTKGDVAMIIATEG